MTVAPLIDYAIKAATAGAAYSLGDWLYQSGDGSAAPADTSTDSAPEKSRAAPKGNDGNTDTPHGSPEHDGIIDEEIQKMRDKGYTDIRKHQTQVNAEGKRVGDNIPDAQGTNPETKQREYVEVDRNPARGKKHEEVIKKNDPNGKCILISCPRK